jgi:hypothetical protein
MRVMMHDHRAGWGHHGTHTITRQGGVEHKRVEETITGSDDV